MRLSFVFVPVAAWLGLQAIMPASAATAVGTAIAVRAGVNATGPDGTRALADGGAVFLGDAIATGVFGQVEIEFNDHTRLAIGPGSNLVIDAYVAGSPGRLNKLGLTAARGAFRFLTGDSPKPAYRLRTPTATIGIRGTEFDFAVARLSATAMALYGGRTRVCSTASGKCADLLEACAVALVDDGDVARTATASLTAQQIRQAFPFLRDEARVSPAMRVGSGRCDGGGNSSSSTVPGSAGAGVEHEPQGRSDPY